MKKVPVGIVRAAKHVKRISFQLQVGIFLQTLLFQTESDSTIMKAMSLQRIADGSPVSFETSSNVCMHEVLQNYVRDDGMGINYDRMHVRVRELDDSHDA